MCSAEAAMAPMTAQNQYAQGKQNQNYYNYLGDQTAKQATEVDLAAEDQNSVINADASRQTKEVVQNSNSTIASQKAAMAANGVYSDSGTFGDIIGESVDQRAMDEAAVKYNADQAIWQSKRNAINQKMGLSAQEMSYRVQGSNARAAGNIGAMNTLVSGAYSGAISAASMGAGGAAGAKGAGGGAGASRGSSIGQTRSAGY